MNTTERFIKLCQTHGSVFTYLREGGSTPCPCRTEQGFRDDVWHKTDQPNALLGSGAGTLDGTFSYTVRFNYDQGEKWAPVFIIGRTSQKTLITWDEPMARPPGGQGPATGVLIYRQREGGPWLLLTEITDTTVLSYEDDNNDDGDFTAQDPIPSVCNAAGFITDSLTSFDARGFIHPVQSGAVRRLTTEQIQELFGEIKADDHVGILPCTWESKTLNFKDWSETTKDRIIYNHDAYTVVSYNLIPAPDTGDPFHHWEVGLRLVEVA